MASILIHLDPPTMAALDRVAAKRKRAEFIREAIRKAIREAEYEVMRRAYEKQPDSAADADDWSNAEAYE